MRGLRIPLTLALAAIVGFAAQRLATVEAERPPERGSLLAPDALDPERVTQIELTRGAEMFRFEYRTDGWWQTAPIAHAVDGWSMRQLVQRALKAESLRHSVATATDGPGSLAAVGLAPAAGRLRIVEGAASDGARAPRAVEIEFGRRSLAGRAFARVVEGQRGGAGADAGADAGGVAADRARYDVIDGALHEFAIDRDVREFRRRELFPGVEEIDRIELSAGSSTTVIVRSGRNYVVESPIKTRADREACLELVDAIKRARSAGFVTDAPADLSVYGLSPAAANLRVSGPGGTRSLSIGTAVAIGSQDRFALVDGTVSVVRVPAAVIAGIAPRASRLIDATATDARPADVGAVEIRSGASILSLSRELEGWRGSEQAGSGDARVGTVDAAAVERLLLALCATRATEIEIGAYPSDRELAVITLRGFAGEVIETVRVARDASGTGFLFENGDRVLRRHGAIDLPSTAADLGFAAPTPATPPARSTSGG
jgi:hypothetical protein